jgi:hypothetical protein
MGPLKATIFKEHAMATIWNHVLLGILLRSQSGDHP